MSNLLMSNTVNILRNIGDQLVGEMRQILKRENRNASHKLYDSIEWDLLKKDNGFQFSIGYDAHGKYVLDSRRRIQKPNPSYNREDVKPGKRNPQTAIGMIVKWIQDKHISIGLGKTRTPLRKKGTKELQSRVSAQQKVNEMVGFAFAIWHSQRHNQRIKTRPTNFLLPYQKLTKTKSFRKLLVGSLLTDGITIVKNGIRSQGNNKLNVKIEDIGNHLV